jgi:hypothetical protein
MKINTSELTRDALNWAIAKCEGYTPGVITIEETIAGQIEQERLHGNRKEVIEFLDTVVRSRTLPTLCNIAEDGYKYVHVLHYGGRSWPFQYSTDWAQGGPIIDREIISIVEGPNGTWEAGKRPGRFYGGPTALISAMRCFVASKLGDTVDIPDDLAP